MSRLAVLFHQTKAGVFPLTPLDFCKHREMLRPSWNKVPVLPEKFLVLGNLLFFCICFPKYSLQKHQYENKRVQELGIFHLWLPQSSRSEFCPWGWDANSFCCCKMKLSQFKDKRGGEPGKYCNANSPIQTTPRPLYKLLRPHFQSHLPPQGGNILYCQEGHLWESNKTSPPWWISFLFLIYLSVAHPFLQNQGESKRIRHSPFWF